MTAVNRFPTRVGLNIVGYKWRGTEFSGKIEADFYAGLSTKSGSPVSFTGAHSVSGVAQFRLRQAYVSLGWDSLPMLGGKDYARVDLTLGQAWHPMAADLCDVISLASGAPFGPIYHFDGRGYLANAVLVHRSLCAVGRLYAVW